jgi:hypothetical protein
LASWKVIMAHLLYAALFAVIAANGIAVALAILAAINNKDGPS